MSKRKALADFPFYLIDQKGGYVLPRLCTPEALMRRLSDAILYC